MHGITSKDKVQGIESFWHNLNEVIPQTELNSFELTCLNRTVEKQATYFGPDFSEAKVTAMEKDGEKEYSVESVVMKGIGDEKDSFLTVSTEENYPVIQNAEFFGVMQPLIDEFGFNVYSCGSLYGLRKWFVGLRSNDSRYTLADGKEIHNFINAQWSHDKSWKFRVYNSTQNIVCMNTAIFSRQVTEQMKKNKVNLFDMFAKRTRNCGEKIALIKQALTAYYAELELQKEILNQFIATPIEQDKAFNVILGFLGGEKEEASTRLNNQANEIFDLFVGGKGNNGQNLFDLFNGVTEYFTHNASDNNQKLFVSSEFGAYAKKKEAFGLLLQSQVEIDKAASLGLQLASA
jgi:hypothetical protein